MHEGYVALYIHMKSMSPKCQCGLKDAWLERELFLCHGIIQRPLLFVTLQQNAFQFMIFVQRYQSVIKA